MVENNDIFNGDKSGEKFSPVKSWQMVTNQSNLFYMIAAGMIMPPDGFRGKYYLDTVSAYPGYLPIFPNYVSQSAVNISISEKEHLLPCVISLKLGNLVGPVKIITQQGVVKDVTFPDEVDNSCQLMLVPAPLPMNYVSSITYRSREDKLRCEKDASDFNNVDLSTYSAKTSVNAFTKLKDLVWPPQEIVVPSIDIPLAVPMAAGAIMGLLLNMNQRGDLLMAAGTLAFGPETSQPELASYPVISAMSDWLQKGGEIESSDVKKKLFWDIVSRVADSKYSVDQSSGIDVAIDYLENMPSDCFDEKTRDYGKQLAVDLRGILGLADRSISEMFERHPKSVSRAMTLFVLRENIEDFLEFTNPQLTDADYILAAILFSAKEGWIGLSKDLRQIPGLNEAVTHRMAVIAHRISETRLELGQPPERPQSLLELLSPKMSTMSKIQKKAALYIARELKWDCIQTRINLGKGDYRLGVTTTGIQLTLDGDINAVITEVLVNEFIDKLRGEKIPLKVDRNVRNLFKVTK